MSYLVVVKELEEIPVASVVTPSLHWSEEEVPSRDEEGKLLKKPYKKILECKIPINDSG